MSSYKFSSVGSRFKKQLGDLMVALHTMEPHYIRCIKPNSFNRPMDFENMNVLHQVGVEGSMVVRKTAGALAGAWCGDWWACEAGLMACRAQRCASTSRPLPSCSTPGFPLQLRCGGVLEAVRISCAGYPTKLPFLDFIEHFWMVRTGLWGFQGCTGMLVAQARL